MKLYKRFIQIKRFKVCKKANNKQYKRVIQIFESVYSIMMRGKDFEVELYENLELYDNKRCRGKTY